MTGLVQVVRYVNEVDVVTVRDPESRESALKALKLLSEFHVDQEFDLVDVESGRLVSWVLS